MSIIKINCDLNNYYSTTSGISQRRDVAKKRLRLLVVKKKKDDDDDENPNVATTATSSALPNFRIQSIIQDDDKNQLATTTRTTTITSETVREVTPRLQPLLIAATTGLPNDRNPQSSTPSLLLSSAPSSSMSMSISKTKNEFATAKIRRSKFKNSLNLKISKYLGKYLTLNFFFIIFILIELYAVRPVCGLLVVDPISLDGVANSNSDIVSSSSSSSGISNHHHHSHNSSSSNSNNNNNAGGGGGGGGHYLDKLDNLERSVAAVLIKVAYGTTSTTKRSIPDNSYVPSLTTIATPPLTTLRYLEKSAHQQQINLHHRNYELDLERDHALPTSAPNADILKSNSNPTYPNPNRHHNHDRDRHRHLLNSTPSPSLPNILKKSQPTIPMYPGDMPSYSPPARSFFTPPLPPEYQNPFADKPTLRGTNNEGVIVNTGTYINRRPIPPPSLMPGHERIPFRPPDLGGGVGGGSIAIPSNPIGSGDFPATSHKPQQLPLDQEGQRKKALNTPSQKGGNNRLGNGVDIYGDGVVNTVPLSEISDAIHNPRQEHLPSIRRILSGSNGRKEDIPEVLLKQVTSRPAYNPQPPSSPVVVVQTSPENMPDDNRGGNSQNPNINQSKNFDLAGGGVGSDSSDDIEDSNEPDDLGQDQDEPKTQPKIKMSTKSTDTPNSGGGGSKQQSQQKQHHLHQNGQSSSSSSSSTSSTTVSSATASSSSSSSSSSSTKHNTATWSVAWNIHVYLSVILFTILGVYSIFKMIFYNKLTHLFSQSYFICIHLILIIICSSRIFYLCYDAYNIHSTFHIFVSEILLNLPATFLTISFSVLILFLLIKSLNHKNNRYSALIRPLTVVVGSGVHVVLCITLHYVESYTTSHSQQFYYQQLYRNGLYHRVANTNNMVLQQHHLQQPLLHHHHQLTIPPPPPPRVLSLICQIIYIFICLSLGLLYLYIYRILKRILRSKSQNYIHGFQNLSYAIHITIATALLFVLLAALQIFGAISISTTRPLITSSSDMDWLQWGYQFSLRLIEIAIITLMSWVAGLKTSGGGGGAGVGVGGMAPGGGGMQREKNADSGHNVAGFFLPCTSSSSQEQFETDYPAICNANTNLHTYTLRTGKPIYDDTFALNSLGGQGSMGGGSQRNDFQLQSTNNFVRPYDTGSLQSGSGIGSHMHSRQQIDAQSGHHSDFLTETQTDHYENPNFELRSTGNRVSDQHQYSDNCYSEPLNGGGSSTSGYDFSNFERPKFGGGIREGNVPADMMLDRPMSRNNDRTSNSSRNHHRANLDRTNYENPERRSSNSTHSCTSARYATYNSFDRHGVVRKSGTLNNIGGIITGRNGSSSSAASSSSRPSGVQTLSTANHHPRGGVINGSARILRTGVGGAAELMMIDPNHSSHNHHQRDSSDDQREMPSHPHRGGGGGAPIKALNYYRDCQLERSNSAAMQQYILQSDDDMVIGSNAERTNLINSSGSRSGGGVDGMGMNMGIGPSGGGSGNGGGGGCSSSGITSSTSGGNLTDNGSANLVTGDRGNNNCGTGTTGSSGMGSSSGESANSGSMLVAEHGFVRFRALDDINNAQGVGIHNASIRTTKTGGGRSKEKQRYASNT
ncbi:uncharacterized protein LOC129920473 [Episyrphus balteatus]|uniref:uncharacterized protein LOC129920473 n=1 Tax=Episyrphus balteatus TaxID=286459 RepID=UPI002486046D|nr:uncharacterized protein LOC129920473 [Episyrphus balteatus]